MTLILFQGHRVDGTVKIDSLRTLKSVYLIKLKLNRCNGGVSRFSYITVFMTSSSFQEEIVDVLVNILDISSSKGLATEIFQI